MDQEQTPFQYKLLEPAQDYKDSVIEKSGIKATFTLREIEANRDALTRTKTELEAQIKVQDATTSNIESFHPFVKDMSLEDTHAAGMFYEARAYRDKCQEKLDSINKILTDEGAEADLIMTTLGLVKAELPPVEEPAVEPVAPEPQTDVPETPATPQG